MKSIERARLVLHSCSFLAIGVFLVLGTACSRPSSPAPVAHEAPAAKVVPVDEVAEHPEAFEGRVTVTGRVIDATVGKREFTLGCEDACVKVPVHFSGTLPEAARDVTVHAVLKKDADGRYFLDAEAVDLK